MKLIRRELCHLPKLETTCLQAPPFTVVTLSFLDQNNSLQVFYQLPTTTPPNPRPQYPCSLPTTPFTAARMIFWKVKPNVSFCPNPSGAFHHIQDKSQILHLFLKALPKAAAWFMNLIHLAIPLLHCTASRILHLLFLCAGMLFCQYHIHGLTSVPIHSLAQIETPQGRFLWPLTPSKQHQSPQDSISLYFYTVFSCFS